MRQVLRALMCVLPLAVCVCARAQQQAIYSSNAPSRERTLSTLSVRGTVIQLPYALTDLKSETKDHPLFYSTYTGDPNRIVARTRYGPVSARDLYVWMIMRESPNKPFLLESYDKARFPKDREAIAKTLRAEIDEYVFSNLALPRLIADAPCDVFCSYKKHIYALPGYQLAYILDVVKPRIRIQPADRIKYLQEHKNQIVPAQRWRVRHIFKQCAGDATVDERDAIETQLDSVRKQIMTGEISFADAVSSASEAPSAENGGEIPPFAKGELFFMFEETAASLKPGELSPVFAGPGGFYLMQLMEILPPEEPSLEKPEQAKLVEPGLTCQVLRAQYTFDNEKLFIDRHPVFRAFPWDERHPDEVIGTVGEFEIAKQEFLDIYPSVEEDGLRLNEKLIKNLLTVMLEREAMAQAVEAAGCGLTPLMAEARKMAANLVRRDNFINSLTSNLPVSGEIARKFWRDNPMLFTPLAVKRVIRLTITPNNVGPTPQQTQDELYYALGLADRPAPRKYAGMTEDDTLTSVSTTDAMTSASAPTTATMMLALDGRTVDLDTTPSTAVSAAPAAPAETRPASRFASLPVKPVPVEIEYDGVPVPPLPLNAFSRIKPSELRGRVLNYKNPDFTLSYVDLGFVHIEDRPEMPKSMDQIPVGGLSKPFMLGPSAVACYIEDNRTMPKPAFDQIKNRVYSTYRFVETGKKLQRAFKDEVGKANIRYAF
ncbi:MAG: peptidylprolyl isomerase [bacterium]